jgi:hypothetical protein
MKPIHKREVEVQNCLDEIEKITETLKGQYFDFPTFRIENYFLKSNTYYRGVWYVESRKKQMYLGSEKNVLEDVKKVHPDINEINIDRNLDKVLDVFLKKLQMRYWSDEYEEFKK